MNEEPGAMPPEPTPEQSGVPPIGTPSTPPAQGQYYRDPSGTVATTDATSTDKVIGIVVMVFAVCGTVFGFIAAAGGGILGAAGASAAVSARGAAPNTAENAAAAGIAGGLVAIFGIILAVVSLLSFVIGFGIMKSRKWAFMLGAVVYGLNALLNIASISRGSGMFGFVIAGALCAYCIIRLTGKYGVAPA